MQGRGGDTLEIMQSILKQSQNERWSFSEKKEKKEKKKSHEALRSFLFNQTHKSRSLRGRTA